MCILTPVKFHSNPCKNAGGVEKQAIMSKILSIKGHQTLTKFAKHELSPHMHILTCGKMYVPCFIQIRTRM